MALDDTDRRRFLLAATVTLIALPALWWANSGDDAGAPNVATVGVDVAPSGADDAPATTTGSALPDPALVDDAPVFLDGPAADGAGVAEIAVPAAPTGEVIVATATYLSSVAGRTCLARDLPTGLEITIVNLDNNRITTCTTSLAPAGQRDALVLHTSTFTELADLTDAPIPVEIRQ